MRTGPTTPLSDRLAAGLDWPSFDDWPTDVSELPPSTHSAGPVNVAERMAEVQRRAARARTVERGGPWVERFDERTTARLAAEVDVDLGPLAFDTVAAKALVAVEGYVTTAGSPVRSDGPVEVATAPIVRRLEALGAITTGTVTMHEFAFGVTGVNPHLGTAPNPAAPDRVPGGSSSGSASAVADGSASLAIGTDTGGSIRIPSAFCGIAGFKPAVGTFSTNGIFPLSATLDHVGFHAATVKDLARVHNALGETVSGLDRPPIIGVARADLIAADDAVRQAIEQAIDRLVAAGSVVHDVGWPDAEATFVASTTIMYSEAAAIHAEALARTPERYGADIRARLELGATLTGPQVAAAHRLRRSIIDRVHGQLVDVDAIVSPTVPIVAPRLDDADDPALPPRIVANTRLGNVVGLPAATLPAPTDGPPVGLQLLGATNDRTLSTAAWAETVLAD